ncbi:hypothetical protein [Nocardiopsis halotolerans]|uniref:hypothetical protein n=1 Tax=Nocardiopsis halotolerans TaxID=124252 RepID=UPI0003472B47|nr:hypothetical protein [Nocardiopsis halotolerans]
MEPTITEAEAADKVREHIDNAMTALPESAELEERRGTIVAACDDPTDGGSGDRVTVGERFWIRGLPMEDNEQNVEALHGYWTTSGYRVLHDQRPDKLFLAVEHEEDAFGMSIRTAGDGGLTIGASSPCVWPEGTPES